MNLSLSDFIVYTDIGHYNVIRFTSVKKGILYLLNRFSSKTRKVGEQSGEISIGYQRSGSCDKVS